MRLNVELGDTDQALLDTLVERTGVTKKKLVVGALMFLAWGIDELDRGNSVVAMPQSSIPYSHTSTFSSEFIRSNPTSNRPKP